MGGAKRYPSPCGAFLRLFTERIILSDDVACPILRQDSKLHHTVKRRVRPLPGVRHQPVLDGVDVDVIDVTREVVLVANGVLPRRCQMPRSPLVARLLEIRSPTGKRREKSVLINRQRVAKFASPAGMAQTAWR